MFVVLSPGYALGQQQDLISLKVSDVPFVKVLEEIRKDPTVHISVSATTREPRPGEVDGVNYYFMTAEKFQEMVQQDGMLESAQYCENFYGTPKKPVEDQLAAGHDVILEIEVVGAMKIRACRPDAVLIFILPLSTSTSKSSIKLFNRIYSYMLLLDTSNSFANMF